MISNRFFILGTFLISLNSVRVFRLGISDWAYLIATILAIFETLVFDKRNLSCWFKNHLLLPAGIIAFGGIISTFRSENVSVAFFEIAQSLFVVTLFVSLSWVMVRRGLFSKIINALIGSGLIAVAIVLIDYLTHSRIGPIIAGTTTTVRVLRFAGPFTHPNTLGSFLVVTSSLILVKLLLGRKRESLVGVFALSIFFFGIYLIGSNTSLAGGFLSLGIIFLFSGKKLRRKVFIFSLLTLSVILLFLLVVGGINGVNTIIDNIERNVTRAINTTIDTRVDIYKYSIVAIQQNPIIGLGYDQLTTSGISDNSRLLPGLIHNTLLGVFYAGGVFSLLGWSMAYLYIATIAIKVCFAQKNRLSLLHLGLAAGVSSIFLMMQFQASLYRRDWWLVIGLLLAGFLETRKGKTDMVP